MFLKHIYFNDFLRKKNIWNMYNYKYKDFYDLYYKYQIIIHKTINKFINYKIYIGLKSIPWKLNSFLDQVVRIVHDRATNWYIDNSYWHICVLFFYFWTIQPIDICLISHYQIRWKRLNSWINNEYKTKKKYDNWNGECDYTVKSLNKLRLM